MEHMMLQVDTPVEDVVLVEDASSDDDDADSYASVVIEDPLLSVAVTDGSTLSTIESPFSSQKFSPKNFHFPFEHMYEALNVIK